jgi:uncharacterized protein YdhG (YjbR/CyaY superfamily)
MTVDEFVEAKVAPQFRPVVAAIRGLMKECAPDAEEVISYGMPVYGQDVICLDQSAQKRRHLELHTR